MKLVHVTTPLAALLLAACGGNAKQAAAPQRAAEQAEHERQEAQEQAQESREEADKARQEMQEATKSAREAEQDARWAAQREAQAERQATEAQSSRPPRAASPELQAPNAGHERIVKGTVWFAGNSAALSPDAKNKLAELAKTLRAAPEQRSVIVEGYSDDSGTDSVNVELSRQRAEEVAEYLEHKGVPRERVTTVALGSQRPISKEETTRGRALNRRVEIVIELSTK